MSANSYLWSTGLIKTTLFPETVISLMTLGLDLLRVTFLHFMRR
jgi:hypothetical protein